MKIFPVLLLAAACAAKDVAVRVAEVHVPWKEVNLTTLAQCHANVTNFPVWGKFHCGGARWEFIAWKWRSPDHCKHYCKAAIWNGIAKGWKAVRCNARKNNHECQYSYCAEDGSKACTFENYQLFTEMEESLESDFEDFQIGK